MSITHKNFLRKQYTQNSNKNHNVTIRAKTTKRRTTMATYDVTITNGQGSQSMKNGTYDVTAVSAPGYDLTTLSPTTFTATGEGATGTFTLSASGTLTINVNETGAQGGTPITSGSIIMTNQDGTEQYGQAVTISSSGDAIFSNVPFISTGFPLYFKQLSTDENHNIYEGIISVSMTTETQTAYVQNTTLTSQTFSLSDANYSGLKVNSASLNFVSQN